VRNELSRLHLCWERGHINEECAPLAVHGSRPHVSFGQWHCNSEWQNRKAGTSVSLPLGVCMVQGQLAKLACLLLVNTVLHV
jgi:hypothetical protein